MQLGSKLFTLLVSKEYMFSLVLLYSKKKDPSMDLWMSKFSKWVTLVRS